MSDIWGPWIDHDGRSCPLPVGTIVHVIHQRDLDGGEVDSGVGPVTHPIAWCVHEPTLAFLDGDFCILMPILRYRLRKPRGLVIAEKLIANPLAETVSNHELDGAA